MVTLSSERTGLSWSGFLCKAPISYGACVDWRTRFPPGFGLCGPVIRACLTASEGPTEAVRLPTPGTFTHILRAVGRPQRRAVEPTQPCRESASLRLDEHSSPRTWLPGDLDITRSGRLLLSFYISAFAIDRNKHRIHRALAWGNGRQGQQGATGAVLSAG